MNESKIMNSKYLSSQNRSRVCGIFRHIERLISVAVVVVWIIVMFSPYLVSSSTNNMLRGHDNDLSVEKFDVNSLQKVKRVSSDNDRRINHAVIVAGHAVMRLHQLQVADKNEDAWYLLPYQLNQGFPEIISSHILTGVQLAKDDPKSLLIFSGGQTRYDVGPTSEAASYYYLAQEKKWITEELRSRIYLDEYARDSFENLLFSLCRFKEVLGYYPTKVTVIGFDFKSDRFSSLHRKAIKFPEDKFSYVGLKPNAQFDYLKAVSGEKLALKSFSEDLYGCNDPALKQKRDIRNPFKRSIPYELACPELRNLLDWCGPRLFPAHLPWEAVS